MDFGSECILKIWEHHMNICMMCGKEFQGRTYRGGSAQKFCHVNCRVKYYRINNRELVNQRTKAYHSSDENKAKNRVQALLRTAVMKGKIQKPTICSKCNESKPKSLIHGHHIDYSKPLDVIWLCPKCHVNINKFQ